MIRSDAPVTIAKRDGKPDQSHRAETSQHLSDRLNVNHDELRAIFARPVAYHRLLAISGGSCAAGVFLSQLLYWSDHTNDPDGWVYKTIDEWWEETALGRYELKTVRDAVVKRGLIQERLSGVPARLYYKIDWETLRQALAKAIETHRDHLSKRGAPTNKFVAMPQTGTGHSHSQGGGSATNKPEAVPRTIKNQRVPAENTTEKTTTTHAHPQPVVVASLSASEEGKESEAKTYQRIAKEFGLNRTQAAGLPRYGLKAVLEQAEYARAKATKNPAAFFLKALKEDYQQPVVVEKRSARKKSVEPADGPAGWQHTLHELYPQRGLGIYDLWANVPVSLQQEVIEHLGRTREPAEE